MWQIHSMDTAPPPTPPQIRKTLGLPPGSIRALLTLMTVGFIVVQTARGRSVGLLWSESLMIVLAHYFAQRRFVPLSPAVREHLKAADLLDDDPNPLHLPKHSLRTLIVLSFVGLAVYLFRAGRMWDPAAVPIFLSVGSYFLGIGFGAVVSWWNKGRPSGRASSLEDTKAIVTLAAMTLAIAVQMCGWQERIPYADKIEPLPLALMLFYFGSR